MHNHLGLSAVSGSQAQRRRMIIMTTKIRQPKHQQAQSRAQGSTASAATQRYLQAQALQQTGHLSQAAQLYQNIMQNEPSDTHACLQLARMQLKAGHGEAAHALLASRQHYGQKHFEFLYLLAALSLQKRDLARAHKLATQACKVQSDSAQSFNLLGSVAIERNDYNAAITAFNQAIALDASYADPHNNIAWAYRAVGESVLACEHFERAYQLEPKACEALSGLLMLKHFERCERPMLEAERVLQSATLDLKAKTELHFALGKAYEDIADYPKAYSHFKAGNQHWHAQLNYSIEEDRQLFEQIKAADYPALRLKAKQGDKQGKQPIPIFVLGLPRSSTSLVEQILASHSEVEGAGELTTLTQSLIAGPNFSWTSERAQSIRKHYLEQLRLKAKGKRYVVDKMPHNFRFIGVILSCFPEARIVHCQRDLRDNALSLYKHHFPMTAHRYAYDVTTLRQYLGLYQDLMQHWQSLAAERIYSLSYEHLTGNFEAELQRLLEYVGLEFEESCLHFQDTKRAIRTASSEQVRKGLYQSGSGQWRHYQDELKALFCDLV